jgi:hypothetical protein
MACGETKLLLGLHIFKLYYLGEFRIFTNQFILKCYVVCTVHFGMKLHNEKCNVQVSNLFICLRLPYLFRAFL